MQNILRSCKLLSLARLEAPPQQLGLLVKVCPLCFCASDAVSLSLHCSAQCALQTFVLSAGCGKLHAGKDQEGLRKTCALKFASFFHLWYWLIVWYSFQHLVDGGRWSYVWLQSDHCGDFRLLCSVLYEFCTRFLPVDSFHVGRCWEEESFKS